MGLCDGSTEGLVLGLSLTVAVGALLVDGASEYAGFSVGTCSIYGTRLMLMAVSDMIKLQL